MTRQELFYALSCAEFEFEVMQDFNNAVWLKFTVNEDEEDDS
jgi:hypothetical protein|tara:strand:+ start:3555 stop:3680 length:126 start_codon:yes stop_codon:yes gene_type:complete